MRVQGIPGVGVAGAAVVSDLGARGVEIELVRRCLAGERAAAHELHQRYYAAASAFLRKLGTRSEEMEDACQEVFLQFFRYLPSFRGDAQLKTWLFRLCITEARRVRRRRRLRETVAKVLGREHPHEMVVPAATHSEATLRRKVESGLDRLGPGHRLVFVLLEMEGLPANQVAEIARCSEATVWRRLSEVRKLCQEMLDLDHPAAKGPA
jgi:RNA polymerase sigma-70 factor (ECF subfamily)